MKHLIKALIARPISVLMLFAGILGFGIFILPQIPVDFYPPVNVPSLMVAAQYPGASGANTRELITLPLEDALSSLPGLKSIESVTRPGSSMIEVQLQWGTDLLLAGVQLREIIDSQFPLLPDGAEKPRVIPYDPNQLGLITIAVYPKNRDMVYAKRLAERELKTELQQAEGVGSVILVGGQEEEVLIESTNEQLASRGITVQNLAEFIQRNNVRFPAGTVREGNLDYVVSTDSEAKSLQDLADIPISGYNIGDIAGISFDIKKRHSGFYIDGKEAVGLIVRNRGDANPLQTAQAIRARIDLLSVRYESSLEFRILEDKSVQISNITKSLLFSLLLGAFVAFFVIIFFLRSIRYSLITLSTIPFSLAATFLGFKIFGISLNSMSLGGLALGIGMLVDTSVVVVENLRKSSTFLSKSHIVESVAAVARGSFASTITSMIVFAPIFFLPGLLGSIYKDLAIAIILSLGASFMVSISLIPVLFLLFQSVSGNTTPGLKHSYYGSFLSGALRKPFLIFTLMIAISGGGFYLLTKLPIEFSPEVPDDQLSFSLDFPENSDIEWLIQQGIQISSYLTSLGQVEECYGRVGGESDDVFYQSDKEDFRGRLHFVALLASPWDKAAVLAEIREFTANSSVKLSENGSHDPLEILLGLDDQTPRFLVQADSVEAARASTQEYLELSETRGIHGDYYPKDSVEGYTLYPNREEISRIGLSTIDLAQLIYSSLEGSSAGLYREDGIDYSIRVAYPELQQNNIQSISGLQFPGGEGKILSGKDLFDIETEDEPARYIRINQKDSFILQFPDWETQFPPELEELQRVGASVLTEQQNTILILLAIAGVILYLSLAAQFESLSIPFIILSTIPITIPGVALALLLGGFSLNVQSGLGILVLLGLVVNNAILLIEQFQEFNRHGADVVIRSALRRLRPILITAATTVLALLPTATGIFGASPQQSLAASVIGGLTLSTLVSLILIPVFLGILFRKK